MYLSREDIVLIVRMLPWRVVLPLAKHVVSLSTLVSVMELPRRSLERRPIREKRVASLAHRVSGLGTRSPGNCLERSLLAYRYLSEVSAGERAGAHAARHPRRRNSAARRRGGYQ